VYDETLIDLTGAPPISVGVAGEVLGLPVWEEDDDDLDDDDNDDDDISRRDEPIVLPSRQEALASTSGGGAAPAPTASQALPHVASKSSAPPAPRPHRDTTPPSGLPRVAPLAQDELDLAGLVASVDEADARPAPEMSGTDSDQPEAPQP
jgi:hypothetical protein